jgi:hypothetical protein
MKFLASTLTVVLAVALLMAACGSKKVPTDAADFLPEDFSAIGMKRAEQPRVFEGQALWEYINGGAELYHSYSFVEVATADYKKDAIEIVADVYRFDSAFNAFGMYSMLRPEQIEIIRLGDEGFQAPATLQFVSGPYMVKLTAFEDTDESGLALVNLAYAMNKLFPACSTGQADFSMFPQPNRLRATNKYWARSYLGNGFLTRILSQGFAEDTSQFTLFFGEDSPAEKLAEWSRTADQSGKRVSPPEGLPFDTGSVLAYDDSFHGRVVAGVRNGKLAGMVNYDDSRQELFRKWLESL